MLLEGMQEETPRFTTLSEKGPDGRSDTNFDKTSRAQIHRNDPVNQNQNMSVSAHILLKIARVLHVLRRQILVQKVQQTGGWRIVTAPAVSVSGAMSTAINSSTPSARTTSSQSTTRSIRPANLPPTVTGGIPAHHRRIVVAIRDAGCNREKFFGGQG